MVKSLSSNNIFFILLFSSYLFMPIESTKAQLYKIPDSFIEVPLIYSHETILRGITKILPVGNIFSNYSTIELSQVNKVIVRPKLWLNDKIFDEIGEVAETERILREEDSPFSDPFFDQFKHLPMYIEDTLTQLAINPLVFCKDVYNAYNKTGVYFELNCTFPFGFFNKYLILRLQYEKKLWYFEKITTFNYYRLIDLLSISETLRL